MFGLYFHIIRTLLFFFNLKKIDVFVNWTTNLNNFTISSKFIILKSSNLITPNSIPALLVFQRYPAERTPTHMDQMKCYHNVIINISFQIRGFYDLATFHVLLLLNHIYSKTHLVVSDNYFMVFLMDAPLMSMSNIVLLW